MPEEKPAGQADPKPATPETPVVEKPAGDTPVVPVVAKPEPETPAGAPEKYALTLPAGSETWLDATDVTALETEARAKGLTNEQAQAALTAHADARAATSAAFRATTEADPIYGGAHLAETERLGKLALDKVRPAGTPAGDAIRRLLVQTGYGNRLEVVSLLADLGKLMAEDQPAGGGGHVAPARDHAAILYDHKG